MDYLTGKDKNKARSILRKALKQGKLLYRQTYYDMYDSCHAPSETPNSEFKAISSNELPQDFFTANYGGLIKIKDNGVYEVSKHWFTKEFKVVA